MTPAKKKAVAKRAVKAAPKSAPRSAPKAAATTPAKKAAPAKRPVGARKASSAATAKPATPAAPVAAPKGAPRGSKVWPCTKEEIETVRDGEGLSWRDVGVKLNIGSPGQARKAYTELTGRDHSTSVMTGRRAPNGAAGSKAVVPKLVEGNMTHAELVESITPGCRLVVTTHEGASEATETLHVFDNVKLSENGTIPAVQFTEGKRKWDKKSERWFIADDSLGGGACRTIALSRIVTVRG